MVGFLLDLLNALRGLVPALRLVASLRCARRSGACARRGVQALVIHFMHAYINDAHERQAREIAAALWPAGQLGVGTELVGPAIAEQLDATAVVASCAHAPLTRPFPRRGERVRSGARRDHSGR